MDNLCKRCYHNYVCEQYNANRDFPRTKCDYKNSHFVDVVDIAPVRHGRWLCVDTDTEQFFLCNRCKKKEYWESNYCPNCGCKMDLEG